MKIGVDARMYTPKFTGIGRYVYELTRNLFEIDQDNEYVLFFNEPEFSRFTPPNKRISKVLVDAPHYSFAEQIKFLKILYSQKLDIMHFTHFNAPVLYRRPSIVTIHDLTLSFFPGNKMNSIFHRLAYQLTLNSAVKRAKKVISVSDNTKKDLQKITKISANKIETIYEAVAEEFHSITDQNRVYQCQLKYNLDRPFLLYTGVWRSHKNLPNLIRAFHILKKEYKLDHYLLITGRKDPVYPEIEQETLSLQLENDVIFTGLVPEEDLVTLYSAADAYVFPSLYEGFGRPVLEAMACETPVICSNSSCLPEICGKGNAIFFNPKSPQDIAEKTYELCASHQLKSELIKNAARHVKTFSWEKMAEKTLSIYKEATA